jgi:hypothetical protein
MKPVSILPGLAPSKRGSDVFRALHFSQQSAMTRITLRKTLGAAATAP